MKIRNFGLTILILLFAIGATGCFKQESNTNSNEYKISKELGATSIVANDTLAGLEAVFDGTIDEKEIETPGNLLKIVNYSGNKTIVAIAGDIKKNSTIVNILNNENVISVKIGKESALEISSKRAGEVLLGDFDSSKEVELSDFTAFAKSYGKYNSQHDIAPASLGTGVWANIYCSAKPDNIVDLNDFIVFAKNYGKKSPIPVIQEVFEEINRPGLEYNVTDDYFMVKPWNYEKESNASRKYPLLIYLHGSDQTKYMKNLYYMGTGYYTWSDTVNNFTAEYNKTIADNFRKTYPCFMYVPQTPVGTGSWDTKKIIAQIEKFKKDYRIDTSRIYLHGFSMGGSGTYELANAYYDSEYKQLFAGIIRLTGSTGSVLRDEIAAKTATWLMIGLQDTAARVTVARDAYTFLKNHSSMTGAVETSSSYMVGTHQANTVILTKDGKERVKKTEYPNEAHFITAFPWEDPTVWAWMFGNSVQQSTVTPTPIKTLTGISVTKQPTKLSYNVGDASLDLTGLIVTGTYSDNSTATETVTTGATTGFSTLTAGIKTITITISGKSTTFTITVVGGTVVPSQSVFPIGVWLQSPIRVNNGKINVVEYKSIGINRFVGLWKWPDETGYYKGYNLQVAKALKDNGMKVYAGDTIQAVDWLKANPEYSDTFIGYMLGDEPDMFKVNYDPVKAPQWLWAMPDTWKSAGEALRAADPTKEFYANFGKPFAKGVYTPVAGSTTKADFDKYVSPTTVYSCDYYGITDPYEPLNNHGVWTYGRAVRLSSQYANGRSVYGFLEVSSPWKVTSSAVEVPDRMPAHLVMPIVWNMVISGAKGITYFCHDFLTTLGADGCLKEPGMPEAMAAANASLQKYADILLSPDISGTTVTVTGNVDVITLTKKFGGSTYVFAMGNGNSTNIYGAPVTATINVAGVGTGTVQVDNENRSVAITNGSFTENFEAYELHIYKITQ